MHSSTMEFSPMCTHHCGSRVHVLVVSVRVCGVVTDDGHAGVGLAGTAADAAVLEKERES